MRRPSAPPRQFFDLYTRDFSSADFQRLFTHDARDALRFFTRHIDDAAYRELTPLKRAMVKTRLIFLAFTLKLSPARRVLFAIALMMAGAGLLDLLEGVGLVRVFILPLAIPGPVWADGTLWLLGGFLLVNLLVLLEVADRLTLKNDLEVAREIQSAMLPQATHRTPHVEVAGITRPANTVGGDFYDILPLADGRLLVLLGDVAGKGSPAALLMALLLAMVRTLATENLPPAALVTRLNRLVFQQTPGSRFITMFLAVLEPTSGELSYVNAGQTPPVLLRNGVTTPLSGGGMALGMFDGATYEVRTVRLEPRDLLLMYSDGVTEAENDAGVPFDEAGLTAHLRRTASLPVESLGPSLFDRVGRHAGRSKFADDLTVLAVRRLETVESRRPSRPALAGVS